MTSQLNTEIGVRRCLGKYEANNQYKKAEVTIKVFWLGKNEI